MQLDQIKQLAAEAARDPSRAARLAGIIAAELQTIADLGETDTPAGYLYAPAHQWLIDVFNLAPEPLPTPDAPNAAAITTTGNRAVNFKVPFDGLVVGGYGWSQPIATPITDETTISLSEQQTAVITSNSEDNRDLFSVSIGLDGQVTFGTDGENPLMFPASTVVGSRRRPREMAWTIRRNQVINVRFRNLTNVLLGGVASSVVGPVNLARATVAFCVLNLEAS